MALSRWRGFGQLALSLLAAKVLLAENPAASRMPTWQDEIAKGLQPYHQLTVEDFPIDDKAHPESSYWIKPFIDPRWHYIYMSKDGWIYAYVDQWLIFSGLDRNESSRKSKFKEMERALAHAQAYLDLNEIFARQLAALKPGELPSARGATPEEAGKILQQNLKAFLEQKYKTLYAEAAEFQKVTNHGANRKKVVELGKALRKRLDALPPIGPPSDSAVTVTPSAAPQSTASPAKSRGLQPPG
ncbi:MAG TPA: hypothetical protein VGW57_00955 [Chthoniobacterales bacterium]|nr:hypothetical protein [Chthoniobacterales bacterium]